MDDQVTPEVETDPDDPRPWVRSYVTIGAVQGDFRTPSAVAVVERAQHPADPDGVSYVVRQVEDLDAETPIQHVARFASKLATATGAARCLLDATTAGAPMLRVWDSQFAHTPRRFHALHIGDRERPELASSRRFTLVHANRLDLLGAVRVALDQPKGLVFSAAALRGRDALDEYVAKSPNLSPEEEEWAPPPTWHLVLALALGVWQLMEEPPDLADGGGAIAGVDSDYMWSDSFRFDRRRFRDTSVIEEHRRIEQEARRARGEIVLPDITRIEARRQHEASPSGRYEFVRLT